MSRRSFVSGTSVSVASVSNKTLATETAFSSATRTTLVGLAAGQSSLRRDETEIQAALLSMQFVPDQCAGKTKHVSEDGRDNDESNRRQRIERLDDVHRLDHVRPENEIDDRLRPSKQNEKRPEKVPSSDERTNNETDLVWISHIDFYAAFGLGL
jgi:hypothetical protein